MEKTNSVHNEWGKLIVFLSIIEMHFDNEFSIGIQHLLQVT